MNREQRRAGDFERIGLKVDGVTYPLDPSDVTGTIELELHRVTGMTMADLLVALEGGDSSPGVVHAAIFVWLSRRTRGESVAFETVADAITYGSEIEALTGDQEESAPEAPAAV